MISPEEYAAFLEREYLRDYIPQGGAAVRFMVSSEGDGIEEVFRRVRLAAQAAHFDVAAVDSHSVKVHMIQEVFHATARQIDWDGLARTVSRDVLEGLGFRVPAAPALFDMETLARDNHYQPNVLNVDFSRELQGRIIKDFAMAQEFRHAMFALCRSTIDSSAATQTTREAVLEWLRGDLHRITAVKDALIYQRIGRHNARHMLFSLAHWLKTVGRTGLVLTIDLAQLGVSKRDQTGNRLYYTKAAVLDAYEVLRQLIDGTDELRSCLVLVGCAPEFLKDPARGYEAYHALQLRIQDEVRDRNRANPFAALVHLASALPRIESAA